MATKHLNKKEFVEKIWDYENSPNEFKFKGERPVIIDFFATWCNPCKMMSPVMDSLADKYSGVIDVYKVDTGEEPEVSNAFRIRSIPAILFIPMQGKPSMIQGYTPQDTMENLIRRTLL